MVMRDDKIWSSKDYVVYSEYDGPIDPHKFVLYKRDGLIDRRMFSESDSVFHRTVFYRLRDGYKFEQEENDSLLDVIKQ